MDVSRSGAWHTMPCIDESTGSKRVINPVTADVNWLIVACLVEIDELIEVKAAPDNLPMEADASVVTPVTPSVPPIVQAFVTPREFNVAAAVVVRVAEEVNPLTARELAAAAPRFPRLRRLPVRTRGAEIEIVDCNPVVAMVVYVPSVLVVSVIPAPGARAWRRFKALLKSCT